MDQQDWDLCRIFAATLTTDRTVRDAAEAELYQRSSNPQLPLALLVFATSPHSQAQCDVVGQASIVSVKLAAACRLRNVVAKSNWNRNAYFEVNVKTQFKAIIVPRMCAAHVDEAIRRQVVAVVDAIVSYDYPQQWDGLVPQLQQLLGTSIQQLTTGSFDACVALRGGLSVLRFCCKRYEDVTVCSDAEIDGFASAFVGPLLELSKTLLQQALSLTQDPGQYFHEAAGRQRDSVTEVYLALRLIWKCMWSLTSARWPLCLCEPSRARDMFQLLHDTQRTLTQLAATLQPTGIIKASNVDDRTVQLLQHVPAWRLAKWVYKMVHRLLGHMGTAPKASEKRARAAAQLLCDSFVAPMVQTCLEFMRWHDDGTSTITTKAFIMAVESIEFGVVHEAAYRQCVLPSAEWLLTSLLFQRLRFSAEDAELWTTNPEEYVRKLTDPRGDLYNERLVSMGLIVVLCHPRKPYHSSELLGSFVMFLLSKLSELLPILVNGSADNAATAAPVYDGCLYAVSQLKKLLSHAQQFDDSKIEWLLSSYVAPLLTCRFGYLRAKAVYTLSLFRDTQWSTPEVYPSILRAIIPLLDDPELPVKIQTCVCLSKFIRVESAREVVTPQVGAVVQQYFNIMRCMDNDGVVRTLRKTVAFYGDTLAQWAIELCQMLVDHFLVVHQQILTKHRSFENTDTEAEENEEVADSLLAADELVETLRTLVQSIPREEGAKATMEQLQLVIAPMLQMIFGVRQGTNLGFMDSALHLLTTVLSRSLTIVPCFWQLAVHIIHIGLDASFMDYVEHLLPPLDNFLSVDPVGFLTNGLPAADGTAAPTTCGALVVQLCGSIVEHGTSFHHLSTVPKLVDAVVLHAWASASGLDAAAAVSTQLLRTSLLVLSSRATAMPPTLQVLFANNVLIGIFATPADALRVLAETQAAVYVMQAMVALFASGPVRPHLRAFDRKAFVVCVARLVEQSANDTTGPLAVSLLQCLVGASVLNDMAVDDMRLTEAEISYHEKRISGKHTGDEDDGTDDEAWDDSSSDGDDTDSDGFDLDDDGGDGDDDGDDIDGDDADIRNDAQFSSALSKAQQLRGGCFGDDFDDDEGNFLEEEDFETPLDDVNGWQLLAEALSKGPLGLPPIADLSTVRQMASRVARCKELSAEKPK